MLEKRKPVRRSLIAVLALAMFAGACGDDDDDSADDGGSPEASICVGGEFSTRPDGLPGLQTAYGFEFADVTAVDEDSLVYNELESGNCTFGSVFATSGQIVALDLTVLEDDEGFFPPYNGSLTMRSEVLDQNPELEEMFAPISEALDQDTMTELNAKAEVDAEEPEDVAQEWMESNDFDSDVDLSGESFTVGSKDFPESEILGNITKIALENAGAEVSDQFGLASAVVRESLTSGEIDMYWDYLGTGWVTYLEEESAIPDPQEQYDALVAADAANNVAWLEPAGFDNTYAIAVTSDAADELGITKISEIKDLAE